MPVIKEVMVGGAKIPGLYKKVSTEGDLHRFASAESGKAQLVCMADTSGRIVVGSDYYDVTLGFVYLMGVRQLMVGFVDPVTGKIEFIPNLKDIQAALTDPGGSSFPVSFNPSNVALRYFDEVSSTVVRVYHAGSLDIFMFQIPHTSTPAATSSRVTVLAQGDHVATEFLGDGDGVMLRAPNGRRGLVRLTNNLQVSVQPK